MESQQLSNRQGNAFDRKNRRPVLTPCDPRKRCKVCLARVKHAVKIGQAFVPEQLVVAQDVKL